MILGVALGNRAGAVSNALTDIDPWLIRVFPKLRMSDGLLPTVAADAYLGRKLSHRPSVKTLEERGILQGIKYQLTKIKRLPQRYKQQL